MFRSLALLGAILRLISLVAGVSTVHRDLVDPVCAQIADAISSASDVYLPGDLRYVQDISHWASSSTQLSKCSVEPGTAEDVSTIIKILASTRTPFAVKGGGHSSNPGFSSTTGVHIAMTRFSDVTYDASSQTATIGTGIIWDDVYSALIPLGVNIVGGRVTGVGVAGFTLGGGYSWVSNQYGLTVDTVVSFELVKPNGDIVNVTHASDPELFFGLKGGLNNFGIVTRFVLQTHPQGQVWGGFILYPGSSIPAINNATAKFSSTNTDPKASLIAAYNFLLEQPDVALSLFYDGPTPPSGIFDDFLAIPHITSNVGTSDFLSLVQATPANSTAGTRALFNSVSLKGYSTTLLNAIVNESIFWGSQLELIDTGFFISYDVEPFLPSAYTHNTTESAWPPSSSRGLGLLPLNLYYSWAADLLNSDSAFLSAIKQSAAHIISVAEAEGQQGISTAPIYPNYALYDAPLQSMYGGNVDRLHSLRERVDPDRVMDLAGGFKF